MLIAFIFCQIFSFFKDFSKDSKVDRLLSKDNQQSSICYKSLQKSVESFYLVKFCNFFSICGLKFQGYFLE